MTIDLYYVPGSAPCRSVLLAAKAIGVDLNLKLTNLMAGEHLKPEFLKVNFFSFYLPLLYVECKSVGSHTEHLGQVHKFIMARSVETRILEAAPLIIKNIELEQIVFSEYYCIVS
jgi:hypothetical protein